MRDSLDRCTDCKMSEDRVCFYAAEIVLALSHMHRIGMLYRDLKPRNVLLLPDGHIKLVDLGAVVDPEERVLKSPNCTEMMVQILNELAITDQPSGGTVQESPEENLHDSSIRAKSAIGTQGFVLLHCLFTLYRMMILFLFCFVYAIADMWHRKLSKWHTKASMTIAIPDTPNLWITGAWE